MPESGEHKNLPAWLPVYARAALCSNILHFSPSIIIKNKRCLGPRAQLPCFACSKWIIQSLVHKSCWAFKNPQVGRTSLARWNGLAPSYLSPSYPSEMQWIRSQPFSALIDACCTSVEPQQFRWKAVFNLLANPCIWLFSFSPCLFLFFLPNSLGYLAHSGSDSSVPLAVELYAVHVLLLRRIYFQVSVQSVSWLNWSQIGEVYLINPSPSASQCYVSVGAQVWFN